MWRVAGIVERRTKDISKEREKIVMLGCREAIHTPTTAEFRAAIWYLE